MSSPDQPSQAFYHVAGREVEVGWRAETGSPGPRPTSPSGNVRGWAGKCAIFSSIPQFSSNSHENEVSWDRAGRPAINRGHEVCVSSIPRAISQLRRLRARQRGLARLGSPPVWLPLEPRLLLCAEHMRGATYLPINASLIHLDPFAITADATSRE